jgi:translation initiation factor IF-3
MRVNERIRFPQIRVIDEDGEQVGVISSREALALAREKGLDLVEISPSARPPVCKIMDYGKYLYELNKKMHEQRKHQKGTRLKEVKMRPRTDAHDYEFKKNHLIRFLEQGDKVRLVMMFRGREIEHANLARKKVERLIQEVSHVGAPEGRPALEGRFMVTILAPKAQSGKQSKQKGAAKKPAGGKKQAASEKEAANA